MTNLATRMCTAFPPFGDERKSERRGWQVSGSAVLGLSDDLSPKHLRHAKFLEIHIESINRELVILDFAICITLKVSGV